MSVDRTVLLRDLQAELRALVADLRGRCDEDPSVDEVPRAEWLRADAARRTARSYTVWRDDFLTDVAVAWLLAGVFVRFCEDNDLIAPPRLGGRGDRLDIARGYRAQHFQRHPADGDREWLLAVFTHARALPGLAEVLGDHNPLWRLGPTADGARRLISFWERIDPAGGEPAHDFTDPSLDTRFLGDLYQDLSESAKKQYALLQTPEFVESFLLDRTLEPAIDEFGLEQVRLIDPTCGSGHFLLGAFARLLAHWQERSPGSSTEDLVRRSLDAVHGVDLNPAAVAIARFRLLVAALKAQRTTRLADLQAFELHLAVGDSLLRGGAPRTVPGLDVADDLAGHAYATEDGAEADQILGQRYHAVVGNPPYITVKDPALNAAYRLRYESCHLKYSLGVPFTERFFDLALAPADGLGGAGYVGMITANSFMKRSFGRKLVEQFLPSIDLTHVIDTSQAHFPGHGTSTVILLGRHQKPVAETVRAVLGIRGQSPRPPDPATGKVWMSIVGLVDRHSAEDEFVTVTTFPRERLATHPWSIGGGGAAELKERLDGAAAARLSDRCPPSGCTGMTNADDVMLVDDTQTLKRQGVEDDVHRPLAIGEELRDWAVGGLPDAVFPYNGRGVLVSLDGRPGLRRWLWPCRTTMGNRATFAKRTYFEEGRPWWGWHQLTVSRMESPLGIGFAEVVTHNHFVLDRDGKLFKQTAPVVKLADGATEEEHLRLLGLLNSSAACFWMKQVFYNKGVGGIGGGIGDEPWEPRYAHDGTKLQQLPIPAGDLPLELARELDSLAQQHAANLPAAVAARGTPTRAALAEAKHTAERLRARMIAAQEELDWYVYRLYGLVDDDLTLPLDAVPPLALGERAFEIVLARQVAAGETETAWFTRHGSTPITEVPARWPEPYRRLVERRIELIETDRDIGLIERPECKRRWATEAWDTQVDRALRAWLLDRLESPAFWPEPRLTTTRALAEQARTDADLVQVAELYAGADVDLVELVATLVDEQAVPYLAAYRYSDSGLRVRAEWERTWELQRAEDAIDARTSLPGDDPRHVTAEQAAAEKRREVGPIAVPPKYGRTDYARPTYWPLRGKLDVPKERFVSYPGARRGNDPTGVVGWAGWDHLQRAQALAGWYTDAVSAGTDPDQLVPLLAGLGELVPWLRQWHNDVDPAYGQRLGDFYAAFVTQEAAGRGLTTDDLAAWRPPAAATRRRRVAR
jgi:hypothetical protein